jgi:hypothetical protein
VWEWSSHKQVHFTTATLIHEHILILAASTGSLWLIDVAQQSLLQIIPISRCVIAKISCNAQGHCACFIPNNQEIVFVFNLGTLSVDALIIRVEVGRFLITAMEWESVQECLFVDSEGMIRRIVFGRNYKSFHVEFVSRLSEAKICWIHADSHDLTCIGYCLKGTLQCKVLKSSPDSIRIWKPGIRNQLVEIDVSRSWVCQEESLDADDLLFSKANAWFSVFVFQSRLCVFDVCGRQVVEYKRPNVFRECFCCIGTSHLILVGFRDYSSSISIESFPLELDSSRSFLTQVASHRSKLISLISHSCSKLKDRDPVSINLKRNLQVSLVICGRNHVFENSDSNIGNWLQSKNLEDALSCLETYGNLDHLLLALQFFPEIPPMAIESLQQISLKFQDTVNFKNPVSLWANASKVIRELEFNSIDAFLSLAPTLNPVCLSYVLDLHDALQAEVFSLFVWSFGLTWDFTPKFPQVLGKAILMLLNVIEPLQDDQLWVNSGTPKPGAHLIPWKNQTIVLKLISKLQDLGDLNQVADCSFK